MILEMVFRGVLMHDVAARVAIRERSRYEEPLRIPSEKDVMQLLAAADRLANSRNLQTQRTWERYRPILYLAIDSGMRPQEYLAVADSCVKDRGVEVSRAIERTVISFRFRKTAAGRRFIDLSSEVYRWSGATPTFTRAEQIRSDFPTSTGRWQMPENWRQSRVAAACLEAGWW